MIPKWLVNDISSRSIHCEDSNIQQQTWFNLSELEKKKLALSLFSDNHQGNKKYDNFVETLKKNNFLN